MIRPGRVTEWVAATLIAVCIIAPSHGFADEDDGTIARLSRALANAEAADGDTSPYLLPIIEELAQAKFIAGAVAAATDLRRRALTIAVADFGCGAPSTAEAMAPLAMLYIDQRDYLDAEPLLITARLILADQAAGDLPAMAETLAGLARIALARGDHAASETWARQAVELARRNSHNRSAEPLRALGAALTAGEHFAEAEQILTEALTQDRKYNGADSTETARSLSQLADLYFRQTRAPDALPLIEQATAIDQSRLGSAHPFIADDLHDLGRVYEALERLPEARKALIAALDTLERGAGRGTPRVAYVELDLSRVLRASGDAAAADAAFKDARRILNKAEAIEHRRERQV